jgi:hypothetical protein
MRSFGGGGRGGSFRGFDRGPRGGGFSGGDGARFRSIDRSPRGGGGPGIVRRGFDGGSSGFIRRRGDGNRSYSRNLWVGGDRDRPRWRGGKGRDWRHGHKGDWRHRHRIRRFGRHIFWGPGLGYYYYAGYYYGDCEWLRERALFTGSRYWWRRYELCRDYDWY